jgi:hypothetical protein
VVNKPVFRIQTACLRLVQLVFVPHVNNLLVENTVVSNHVHQTPTVHQELALTVFVRVALIQLVLSVME